MFYKLELNELSVPVVKECIRVDDELHVKLFYKGSPVPLPEWFRKGRDCKLTRKSVLQNLPNYVRIEGEQTSSIFEELKQIQFQKKPRFSSNVIRYALLLRYTSLQSYRLIAKDFPLPSLSFLKKITEGGIDAVKALQKLKEKGKISKDVVLIFDEMFLQKCEELYAGNLIGANDKNELYKGVVSFMVAGLKESVSYVLKAVPETKIDANFLREHILDCLRILKDGDFKVRAIVCDDHSSNVSAFKLLLKGCGLPVENSYMTYEDQKIYLFHDTVHLAKCVRNNLLNYKRFLFPAFKFEEFEDVINVPGGSINWKTFHDLHERDSMRDAYLRKSPMITPKVSHPGKCKQCVPTSVSYKKGLERNNWMA